MSWLIQILLLATCALSASAANCGIPVFAGCTGRGTCNSATQICSCNAGYAGDNCEFEISFSLTASTSYDESQGSVVIQVTRVDLGYTLDLTLSSSGSATIGADYTLAPTNLAFSASEGSKGFLLTIVDDTIVETDETIIITATHTDGTSAQATYTVTKNDPVVINNPFQDTVNEGQTGLSLSSTNLFYSGTQVPITIQVAVVDGTALSGTDYNVNTPTVTIAYDPADPTSRNALDAITIDIPADNLVEGDKTFNITFTSDYALGGDTSKTITVADDDELTIVSTLPSEFTEGTDLSFQDKFSFQFPTSENAPVTLTVTVADGTATLNTDYTLSTSTPLTFTYDKDNQTSLDALNAFTISATENNIVQKDRQLTITFSSIYNMAGALSRTVTIKDDDPETITVSAPESVAENAGSTTLNLTRNFPDRNILVTYQIRAGIFDNTLYNPNVVTTENTVLVPMDQDFFQIVVTLVNDNVVEVPKTFTLSVSASPLVNAVDDVTVNITEDDTYEVTFSGVTVVEGDDAVLTFRRDSSVNELNIIVSTSNGTAQSSSDYTQQNAVTVTFENGNSETNLTIPTTSDEIHEDTETFDVTIDNFADLKGSSTQSVTVNITDNDDETLTVTSADTVDESDGSITFTITRTVSFESLPVTVETVLPAPGSSASTDDIDEKSESLIFASGSLEVTFTVNITDDDIPEARENFTVRATAGDLVAEKTVEIISDDAYTITFSNKTVSEGDPVSIEFTRDSTSGPLTITVATTDGTAKSPGDFTAFSGSLEFANGSNTASVSIDTTEDGQHEETKFFTVSVSSTSPLTADSEEPRGMTINDDDPEVLTVDDVVSVNEEDGTVVYSLHRTASYASLTVAVATAPSGAVQIAADNSDITQLSSSVTFAEDALDTNVTVDITNDELAELDEEFSITFTPSGSIVPVTKKTTILDTDPVGITITGDSQPEGGILTATFTRDSTVDDMNITVNLTDLETDGMDYVMPDPLTLNFAAGDDTVTLDIQTNQDGDHEKNETISVDIASATENIKPVTPATLTIENEDDEVLQLNGGGNVQEDAGNISLTLVRTTSFEDRLVTIALAGNGANQVDASDLTNDLESFDVTIPQGQLTFTVVISIEDDDLFEFSEGLRVTAESSPGLQGDSEDVVITNDDDYEVTFEAESVNEGSDIVVVFTRDSNFGELDIAVSTSDITAVDGEDYTGFSGTVTFGNGESTANLTIPTLANDLYEMNDTFSVDLTIDALLKPESTTTQTMTILNDDKYGVTFDPQTKEEGMNFTIVFTRNSTEGQLIVRAQTTDVSAVAGDDYEAQDGVDVTFNNGEATATLWLPTTQDTDYENNETFTVQISSDVITEDSKDAVTFTIEDNDVEVLTVSGGGEVPESAGNVSFTVSRTAAFEELTASAVVTGSGMHPTQPGDFMSLAIPQVFFAVGAFNVTVTVDIDDDDIFEFDEEFTLTVTSGHLAPATGMAEIKNDDAYGLSYGNSSAEEGDDISVVITRDSSDGELIVVFDYLFSVPNAASVDDLPPPDANVTFSQGDTQATLHLPTNDDIIPEGDESFLLVVDTASEPLKESDDPATMTILNDDTEVLSISNATVDENAGSLNLTVTRLSDVAPLTVTVSTNIDGLTDEDYPIQSDDIVPLENTTVVFAQGSLEAVIEVTINNNDIAEADEMFKIRVEADDPIEDVETTVTILNDDPDVVTMRWFLGLYEDGGSVSIRLTRTVDDKEITVNVQSTDGTATAGVDYEAVNVNATFARGSLTTTFDVVVKNDAIIEGNENFTLVISGDKVVTSDPYWFIIADNEGGRAFECKRPGQDCLNETDLCIPELPMCGCSIEGLFGDSCDIPSDLVDGPACAGFECGDGYCIDTLGNASCRCKSGFYGDRCQHEFLQAVCTADYMMLIANPVGNFGGKIYIKEYVDVPACHAKPVAELEDPDNLIDDTLMGYFVKVNHSDSECGVIEPANVPGRNEYAYARKMIIQYRPDILTGVDQIVIVSCTVSKDNLTLVVGTVTIDDAGPPIEESATNGFSPLSVDAINPANGSPLTEASPVPLGMRLCIKVSIGTAFGAIEIIRIAFSNNRVDLPQRKVAFQGRCIEKEFDNLLEIPGYPDRGNKRVVQFCFQAFKFQTSPKLKIEITVKICLDPANCDMLPCSAALRRKRQTETTSEKTVESVLTISEGAQQSSQVTQNPTQDTTSDLVTSQAVCSLPAGFIPTVVSLGVLVFLLVLVCLILTYKLVTRPKKFVDRQPEPIAPRFIPQWLVLRR